MAKTKRSARPSNPLVAGILSWIAAHDNTLLKTHYETQKAESSRETIDTDKDIPKRYTVYQPMLLLGPTFETHTSAWASLWSGLTDNDRSSILASIVDHFCRSGQAVTHVAVNAPIAATTADAENIMRSPLHLKPLYGEFGPDILHSGADGPCERDFQSALWVQVAQVEGVMQCWAPRWTMFSRGNIREKARILGRRGGSETRFPGLEDAELGEELAGIDVMDFYVGIGYFALPYLERGVRRVFGWEINGWSVEGLRRGCEANGWKCLVVRVHGAVSLDGVVAEVVQALRASPDLRCVVFWGDNAHAAGVMEGLSKAMGNSGFLNIRHCNLGLLPSSSNAWLDSVRVLSLSRGGWMHVHENVEISEATSRASEVVDRIQSFVVARTAHRWMVQCEHTEMVKTYAPGVGHFVFDIHLWPAVE